MVSSLRIVDTIWATDSTVRTAAQFVVEAGRPGIAAVEQEPSALAVRARPGKIYDVHDDQDAFPLRG